MNIGTIIQWGSNVIPNDWLLCDGSAVSRTTYADLFAVIGTNFGIGDGSTTFNLPDLRGRIAVGKSNDSEFDTLGKTGGSKTDDLSNAYAKIVDNGSEQTITLNATSGKNWDGTATIGVFSEPTYEAKNETYGTNLGGSVDKLQPYVVTNYIIKALKPSEIKISELNSATSFNDEDYTMIVQNGENKKITKKDFNTYSTTETVIGKWINGKPIYRKVINNDNIGGLPNASQKSIAHGISNIESIINLYGMADNGTVKTPINYSNSVYAGSAISAYVYGEVITIGCSFDGTAYGANIVLEYTKTTD